MYIYIHRSILFVNGTGDLKKLLNLYGGSFMFKHFPDISGQGGFINIPVKLPGKPSRIHPKQANLIFYRQIPGKISRFRPVDSSLLKKIYISTKFLTPIH